MKQKINIDFLALTFLLFALQVPYLRNDLWPEHGTLVSFLNFYSFYNDFFLHHDLVGWIPFGSYGVPASFWQLIELTPVSYAVMLIGKLFQLKNVLLVFKLNVFFEQWLFLSGMYCLGRYLYRSRAAVWFVCAGCVAGIVWFYEISWNLRIFYLLPFAILFLFRFFEQNDSRCFWKSLIVLAVSLLGNLPYYAPLYFLLFLILGCVLLARFRTSPFRRLWTNIERDKYLIFILTVILIPIFYFTIHSLDGVQVYKSGRSASSLFSTNRHFFLTDCAGTWSDFFEFVFFALGRTRDNTKYIGLLPWFFIMFSFISFSEIRKRTYQIAFLAVSIFLIFFSVGEMSPVAGWVFDFFPPIRFLHYIGQVGSLLRMFLILIAGFGFDQLAVQFKGNAQFKIQLRKPFLISAAAISVLICFMHVINHAGRWFPQTWPQAYLVTAILFLATLILVGSVKNYRMRIGILMAAFLLDLSLYQGLIYSSLKSNNLKQLPETVRSVRRYPFPETRHQLVKDIKDESVKEAMALASSVDGLWIEGYDFSKYDPCVPSKPAIYEAAPVAELTRSLLGMDAPLGSYLAQVEAVVRHPAFQEFINAIGCDQPKLKLFSEVQFARNARDVQEMMIQKLNFSRVPVILSELNEESFKPLPVKSAADSSSVQVSKFYSNVLKADVTVGYPNGEWLCYLDAFHRGWQAWVDGRRVTIDRANLAFKAIFLSPGKHRIEFRYFNGLISAVSYYLMLVGLAAFVWLLKMSAPLFRPENSK